MSEQSDPQPEEPSPESAAAPSRVLSSPIRLTGRMHTDQLSSLVTSDVLRRSGDAVAASQWSTVSLTGDLAGLHAAEQVLLARGVDRHVLGRERFADEVRAFEREWVSQLAGLLASLRISIDSLWTVDEPKLSEAARVAFVRLYEQGLLERGRVVVGNCPRCGTAVDDVDADPDQIDTDELTLAFSFTDGEGELLVDVRSLELLIGTTGVAVPPDSPAAGREVIVPLRDRPVPVFVDEARQKPQIVVPAHGASDYICALENDLDIEEVFDVGGEVQLPGPFRGMSRFAARRSAKEHLEALGVVRSQQDAQQEVRRCRRCETILVPRLGWHWMLDMSEIELEAADAVREGAVEFPSIEARDVFLQHAGTRAKWCLSHQLWSGAPVPVAHCLDCGGFTVAVDVRESCPTCMGTLQPEDAVLDARFVGAVWPLAEAGWPDTQPDKTTSTTLTAGRAGVTVWGLAMAALGLHLTGTIPFDRVTMQARADVAEEDEPLSYEELSELVRREGTAVMRTALLGGTIDPTAARNILRRVDEPNDDVEPESVSDITASWHAAIDAERPDIAIATLEDRVSGGVDAQTAEALRIALEPALGQ